MTFSREIDKISVTITPSDGSLGKVLSTASSDKKKIFGTVAARALLTAVVVFFWVRTGESMTITAVLGGIFGVLSLSPLRFLGNELQFCEYGVRYNKKDYLLPQNLHTTWERIERGSCLWASSILHLGTECQLNITYIKNAKKAFLLAYQPNTIL